MATKSGLVSIITPIKNGSELFRSTYDSVINQDYEYFEWFVIDDGSSSEEKVKIINCLKDERVKLISTGGGLGAGGARNKGIELINGQFLTFIDSDDLWDSTFLKNSISQFKEDPKLKFVFSGYRRYISNENIYLKDFIPTRKLIADDLLKGSDISCLTAFFDTSLLDKTTKFGSIPARNDLVFFYRLLSNKTEAIPLQEVLATYRIQKKSVSSNKLRALYYQFIVNRYVAHKSIISSILNVISWIKYGLKKYSK